MGMGRLATGASPSAPYTTPGQFNSAHMTKIPAPIISNRFISYFDGEKSPQMTILGKNAQYHDRFNRKVFWTHFFSKISKKNANNTRKIVIFLLPREDEQEQTQIYVFTSHQRRRRRRTHIATDGYTYERIYIRMHIQINNVI